MRVFVLGHRGMLGHVVARYLKEEGFEIVTSGARYTGTPDDPLIQAVVESRTDWVVNAIGNTGGNSADQADLFLANTIFPVHIKSFLRAGQKMIHASSDAVFSGKRGNYHSDEPRDANDLYGLSKLLGEVVAEGEKCCVIRTSIIGPGGARDSGLINWFLSQKKQVNGFTNHFWNGITTLEWAKVCVEIMRGEYPAKNGIIQPGSPERLSKFELVSLISEIWRHTTYIQPLKAAENIDRTLVPDIPRISMRQQLQELHKWH